VKYSSIRMEITACYSSSNQMINLRRTLRRRVGTLIIRLFNVKERGCKEIIQNLCFKEAKDKVSVSYIKSNTPNIFRSNLTSKFNRMK
jgi:hypothetical protein